MDEQRRGAERRVVAAHALKGRRGGRGDLAEHPAALGGAERVERPVGRRDAVEIRR